MNDRIRKQYCRQVGKHLLCSRKTKHLLLQGLGETLEDFPGSNIDTLRDLEAHFGKIPQIAAELQESVSIQEKENTLKKRKWCTVLAVCAALCISGLLLWWAFCYFQKAPYYIVETIQEG